MMPTRKKVLEDAFQNRIATYSLLTGFENFGNNYERGIEYVACIIIVPLLLNFKNMNAAFCQNLNVNKKGDLIGIIYSHPSSIQIIA